MALTLVLMGIPLWIFGWAVARRRFDLVFGDYTAETTTASAWTAAHEGAGRNFQRLGALLSGSGPVVLLAGFPAGIWIFGSLMAVLVVGVYIVATRALTHVERGQMPR